MKQKKIDYLNTRVLMGLGIVIAGVILLLPSLGVDVYIDVWDYWPVFLILAGIGHLSKPEPYRKTVNGLVLAGVGFVFLGNNLNWFDISFVHIWPLLLILAGATMIHHASVTKQYEGDDDFIRLNYILSGGHKIFSGPIKGGAFTAILGGGEIDMREVILTEETCVIDLFLFWGGFEIKVPADWHVKVEITPILGGVENKKKENTRTAGQKTLLIKGTAIMGGAEIN